MAQVEPAKPAKPSKPKGRVLIVAGSDSGGGAGIQADIKAVTALGGYAATAITALTAQDTKSVHAVMEVPPALVAQQIAVVRDDIGADACKTGMLHNASVMEVAAAELSQMPDVPRVCDPVMVAKGGARLLERRALDALKSLMVKGAFLVTPNLPEAEILAGFAVDSERAQWRAAEKLMGLGARAALVKGGHGRGAQVVDILMSEAGEQRFAAPRLETTNTHGTGCTLASAIACGLAQGLDLAPAAERALAYVREAIQTAPGFGRGEGHGPLNHACRAPK